MKIKQEWWCIDLGQSQNIKKESLDRLSESLFLFTPDVVQGKNRIFLEMSRRKKFFNLNSLQSRAWALAAKEGLDATTWRFGVGATLPESWVQTRWRARDSKHLPIEAYFDFIYPLHHFELKRSMRERLNELHQFGAKNLNSLVQTPKEAWLVVFGDEFDAFLENFEWGGFFPWKRFSLNHQALPFEEWFLEDAIA